MAALVISQYLVAALRGNLGFTTEVSALLAFLLGLLCARGHLQLAAWVAVAMALLLALKDWLHRLARRVDAADVEATLKFAIVTLIILPLVPDQSYGPEPLNVLNPYKVWLMVVLISGLNFASYLLIKVIGAEHGIGIAGLLGGLVSSTAVTLGFAAQPPGERFSALGIVLRGRDVLPRDHRPAGERRGCAGAGTALRGEPGLLVRRAAQPRTRWRHANPLVRQAVKSSRLFIARWRIPKRRWLPGRHRGPPTWMRSCGRWRTSPRPTSRI